MQRPVSGASASSSSRSRRWLNRLSRAPSEQLLTGPLGGELLGPEALAERARAIAGAQQTGARPPRGTPLLERLDATRRILIDAHARISQAASGGEVGPAGDWLLDNFYVVLDHISEVRQNLPRGYYRELPSLASGSLTGYPRVYELAIALISHTESRLDLEVIGHFTTAFQEVTPLNIGELWALPAMLRLALVESVRRMALRTVQRLDQFDAADGWALRLHAAELAGTEALAAEVTAFSRSHPAPTSEFVARLHQRLRFFSSHTAIDWVESWLEDEGHGPEEAVARSTQRLALTQVTMANSITSLRTVGGLDWPAFVEAHSRLEAVLRTDPAGIYPRMTFETRDGYRHVVEKLARRTRSSETAVALRTIALSADTDADSPRRHVGWFLVDEGVNQLEHVLGARPSFADRLRRAVRRHPTLALGLGTTVGMAICLGLLLWLAGPAARQAWPAVLLLGLIPAHELALQALQQLVTQFLPPRRLPKLDFLETATVPPEFATAVVVPTLFASVGAVEHALENLEVEFLANRGPNLKFIVLSDFTDAPTESVPGDVEIVAAAQAGVRELEARYGDGRQSTFYLLHRARQWNPAQGVWMGWERKRGKLTQLNRLILGADGSGSAFSATVGDLAELRRVRFVITLDADTLLPPDTAPLLIGALAHPLNRAVYDPVRERVVRGYAILQPRVGVSLPSANRTRFASIVSGEPGVDPYTTAVSDVYQDLYDEGSFAGKGIYDVEAFERATRDRFPDNTLLSHDLIEGGFARAGLATDIKVYDEFPSRYLTWTQRKHRWIRGDWQLLRWMLPRVPGPGGTRRNPLSLLSRWKIFDNLRRSVLELSQVALLVAGWTLLPGSALRWTALVVLAVGAPWILNVVLAALQPPLDRSWRAYYVAVGHDAVMSARQALFTIAFLPHQAWISADAILRTLWRLAVSRRNLLEWRTASQTERSRLGSARDLWRSMWPTVALTAGLLVLLVRRWVETPGWQALPLHDRIAQFLGCVLLGVLWLTAPWLAHRLNGSPVRSERRLVPRCRADALRYALLHWNFFRRFVTAETHWLAPDNFQETPVPVVAMRTSPTNIGLQLLAIVSAHDLGFVTLEEMLTRVERVFASLARMRRFRGHFLNWYDLKTLEDMAPGYISTVDSGNLAGHLIALRQACLGAADEPVLDRRIWPAVDTALVLAQETASPPLAHRLELVRAALGSAAERMDVAAALAEARSLLDEALRASEAGTAPSAWIAWAAERIDVSTALIDGLVATGAPSRGGVQPRFPSCRQCAIDSPGVAALVARLEAVASECDRLVTEMEFGFLYDAPRALFAIGYQLASHTLDTSHYDLLASEARLASFVAIAKNDVPVEHWFHLGRELTRAAGATALMSWSGTMFEYLMPALVMRSFPFTLLDQTYQGAVHRQIAYGSSRGVPWGISECAYNLRDHAQTYQYRTFGVPDLALKRGLDADLVVAPYASALAALVEPTPALTNLRLLERRGALGPYGFRDALDFTRPTPGRPFAVVENYMAHHLGMGLVALTNALTADRWQQRFHADPLVRAAELLLHERIPHKLVFQEPQAARAEAALPDPELERPAVRQYDTPDTPTPRVALLGRLPYTIMVTNAGSGYSRLGDLAVTRWRADGTTDASGQFCYLRDVASGKVWSSAHQPTCVPADSYQAALATDRVVFHRTDGHFETRTEITTAPDDSAEVRRVTVTNNGSRPAEVELTSYGEWVLAPPNADRAHPAFGNLFVETEWHDWCQAITATRRPRSAGEGKHYGVHVIALPEAAVGAVTFETDRARFLGRGRSVRNPAALAPGAVLGGGAGAVLDPIFALRTRLRLLPGRSASVAFTTAVLDTPERAFDVADRYRDPRSAQRALDLAWTTAQIELRELATTSADAALYETLAGDLFFSDPRLRAPEPELLRNTGSQPLLWSMGVSGDWPIVLATVDSIDGLPTVLELLRAHRYWRRRGMMVDLLLLNTRGASYVQDLTEKLTAAVRASSEAPVNEQPGGVLVRRKDLLRPEELQMLRATARVHVVCDGRKLGQIIDPGQAELRRAAEEARSTRGPLQRLGIGLADRLRVPTPAPKEVVRVEASGQTVAAVEPPDRPPLRLDNGFGGLAEDGAYEIRLGRSGLPPAPWSNVVASEAGGFLVTERGGGFSWAGSSYFFRLTPWHNDPVGDPASDIVYLQDEETRAPWSATPGPCSTGSGYTVRHLPGMSTFTHQHEEISVELTMGLDERTGAKVSRLRLRNTGSRARRLSVTAYVEWALGPEREHTQHQVRTEHDPARGAMFARNTFDPQFASWHAFCAMSPRPEQHTGDRREFLGRNGSTADPVGLRNPWLAGRTGEGVDPCAALKHIVELAPGQSAEVVVVLGACASRAEAQTAVDRLLDPTPERCDLATVTAWEERLSVVRVSTPDRAFDALMNRWLLYQALSCRMWGRSALYQSGGAYGFRDQLQDSMAFLLAAPEISRAHLLRAAERQFEEGDVQHWWHPESGRGVRTRFSDDLAWLPFVAERYVRVTGDFAVLDAEVPFLSMRPLRPDELELYEQPSISPQRGTLFEHCRRALRKACTTGAHGLPLIGTGDWNDGMNRVGIEGRGESVWLAWFLVSALRSFAPLAALRGEASEAAWMRDQADAYVLAVEEHGWDGGWYRRAFFDDGTPLGSAGSEECQIDSIAQSWSVISGAGRPERQDQAMGSLRQRLVDPRARLLALLTPPFDRARPDPGYIQGYLPGIRENGAQYTHGALWAVLAMALQKDGDLAFEHFQMLNPLTHALSPETVATYKVEPYVVAADVYTAAAHLGRGGWTWYTGSASWMYRVGLEAILGFSKEGATLRLDPCVPRAWTDFRIDYRYGATRFVITASQVEPGVRPRVLLDGVEVTGGVVPLRDDGGEHHVSVTLPRETSREGPDGR